MGNLQLTSDVIPVSMREYSLYYPIFHICFHIYSYDYFVLYRDTRLINWSCALQSAISEIEVDYVDLEGRTFLPVPGHKAKDKYEFGTITSFAYRLADGGGEEIVVATTRLETMLGDTAVAVHPDDPRYTHMHGKMLLHPFLDRKIPIITDGTLVDMSFGTGAVKVTPAHDPNDYLCGKRHNLDFIIVLTEDGKMAANAGEFAGLMRYDARIAMEERLNALGLLRGKEPNKMRLGLCSRSGDIIEPMLTPQWYVNCTSMAERSIAAVRNGDLKIVPEMHEATWFRWLENIRDWCVSRQLWWGHRIPAYFARVRGETPVDKNDPTNADRWVVARTPQAALEHAEKKLGQPGSNIILDQDEDVLDTWFSSGLFPFSVFGWPEQTADLQAFYPTSLLETGQDILFFWVARMVMMGIHLTGQLPFKTVYLHSMVRDKYGRKMSKSLGNVIDPLEVINGCALADLLKKVEEGNLPAKEVSHLDVYCVLRPCFVCYTSVSIMFVICAISTLSVSVMFVSRTFQSRSSVYYELINIFQTDSLYSIFVMITCVFACMNIYLCIFIRLNLLMFLILITF